MLPEEAMNKVDEFYKGISLLILKNGGEILPADEPKQLKIGYIWFVMQGGKEIYKNPAISIFTLKKHFNSSKTKVMFDELSINLTTQDGKIKVSQELANRDSKIHRAYFSEDQIKEISLEYSMNEALE